MNSVKTCPIWPGTAQYSDMSPRSTHDAMPPRQDRHDFLAALIEQAITLGVQIADGDAAGISQGETTITETALLNLHRRLGGQLKTNKMNQNQEGENGADWIWCTGDENGWFSFYVQAKKLKDDGYDIGYRTDKSRLRQVDKLILAARAAGVMPVYVLYNPASDIESYSTRACAQVLTRPASSITYVAAVAASGLLTPQRTRTVRLEDMRQHTHPWSCLAWCFDEPDSWFRALTDDPRIPPSPFGLPSAFFAPGVPGAMARLAASPALDGRGRPVSVLGGEYVGQFVRDLVRGAFTELPPLWVTSPEAALERWQSTVSELASQTREESDDWEVYMPSVVVSQRFRSLE